MASILKTDKIEGVTASGTVQMPAGHVIQSAFHQWNTETSTSSTSFVTVTGSEFNFTAKSSTSLLHVRFDVSTNFKRNDVNAGGTLKILIDGSDITGSPIQGYMFYINQDNNPVEFYGYEGFETEISATNTSQKTIKLQTRNYTSGNSNLVRINQGGYFYSSIKVQDIAQ